MKRYDVIVPVPEIGLARFGKMGMRPAVVETLLEHGLQPVPIHTKMRNSEILGKLFSSVGVFLTGGMDMDSRAYNEEPHPTNDPADVAFTRLQIGLVRKAFAMKIPLRTVCLGHQVVHVAFGGSLHQHIPDLNNVLEHRTELLQPGAVITDDEYAPFVNRTRHLINVDPDDTFMKPFDGKLMMNSAHHQAIKGNIDDRFKVAGTTNDGIVEIVKTKGQEENPFYIGVQGHVELVRYSKVEEMGAEWSATLLFANAFFDSFYEYCEYVWRQRQVLVFAY